jgi:hypothetical protein
MVRLETLSYGNLSLLPDLYPVFPEYGRTLVTIEQRMTVMLICVVACLFVTLTVVFLFLMMEF